MSSTGNFTTENLAISFGGLKAVSGFTLSMKAGELVGLIGPNGAGKTTIFNLITGVYTPDSGAMAIDGDSLVGLSPHEIASRGVARTFQNIRLCGNLSVLENVLLSFHMRVGYGYADLALRTKRFRDREAELEKEARELLTILGLDERRDEVARCLPYGDQRRLEIARALATRPKVLLLDEPAAGLNSGEKVQLMQTVAEIRRRFDVTILLIDHDMKLIMGICERIIVLDHGEMIAQGKPKEIQENPKVIEAYLGVS